MRTLRLLLTLVLAPVAAFGQNAGAPDGAIIESAEVSGIAFDQLSPGLRQDIDALAGTPLVRQRLTELASRIEGEHPDRVAAVRDVTRPDGRVHVVFLAARISDDDTLEANINARYVVEQVEVSGIDEARISQGLRDAMQALVGRRLDPDEADDLSRRLKTELGDYGVRHRVERGSEPGRIRVVFQFTEGANRHLVVTPSKIVYHQEQGWSTALEINVGTPRAAEFSLGLVRFNNDDLVEEYSGFWLGVDLEEVGRSPVGLNLRFSRFTQDWRAETLAALASDPAAGLAPYRVRRTVEPAVTFRVTPQLRLAAGASASELTRLSEGGESTRVNAALASVSYAQTWRAASGAEQSVQATYSWRAGVAGLDSDLVYRRHGGRARYQYERGRSTVIADLQLGRISGEAPLFERFTLGDSATLRGWNKYDIVPAGATRMVHQSIEYRYRGIGYFIDAGSVWSGSEPRQVRLATGVGFYSHGAFLTVGFPINADHVGANVMLGVRFGVGHRAGL